MSARNDVTGDKIQSRPNTDQYRDNYDRIFRDKEYTRPVDLSDIESDIQNQAEQVNAKKF